MRGSPLSLVRLFSWLIENIAELHDALVYPGSWSSFANGGAYPLLVMIFQAAQALNIPTGGNYHIPSGSVPFDHVDNPGQGLVPHAFEAIVGADNFVDVDNHVMMKDVLNEIVDVTRTVSLTCERSIRSSCQKPH